MNPYLTSGYKTNRAASQARAFKTPSQPGLLAPGYPIEAPPAPPPPPPIVPVMGGGAAAGAGAVLGTVGLVAVGAAALYGAYDITKTIRAFKKNAKLPFYDADGIYAGGIGLKTNPYWSGSGEVGFDQEADLEYQQFVQNLLDEYMASHANDGRPLWVYRPGTRWRIYRIGSDAFSPHNNGRFTTFVGYDDALTTDGYTHAGWVPEWNYVGMGLGQRIVFEAGDPVDCIHGTGRCALPDPNGVGFTQLYTEWYVDETTIVSDPSFDTYERTVGDVWQVQTNVAQAVPLTDDVGLGVPLHQPSRWADAAAAPLSQPSLDEQVAGKKLPKGKSRHGYYGAIPLNYPFTVVGVAPGSPPFTVPDVVIDPDVGPILTPPAAPPEAASPAEKYERKPRSRFNGQVFMSVATEWQDFLEAMHKGLPKKHRTKGRWGVIPDGDIVLRDIIDHWDEWDADLALEHFVNNQIEDMLLGKVYFGNMSKFNKQKRFGVRGTGAGAGLVPIPEVHFANGEHSVSVGDTVIEFKPEERMYYGLPR